MAENILDTEFAVKKSIAGQKHTVEVWASSSHQLRPFPCGGYVWLRIGKTIHSFPQSKYHVCVYFLHFKGPHCSV